jgi:hypothetical protein
VQVEKSKKRESYSTSVSRTLLGKGIVGMRDASTLALACTTVLGREAVCVNVLKQSRAIVGSENVNFGLDHRIEKRLDHGPHRREHPDSTGRSKQTNEITIECVEYHPALMAKSLSRVSG